ASVCASVSRCGSAAVAFMPQILRLSVDSRAGSTPRPNGGRAGATSRPQIGGIGCSVPVTKPLPESGLVPLAAGGVFERNSYRFASRREIAPVPELPMFSVFVPSEAALKKLPVSDPALLPDNAVWIDLLNPTMEEDRAVERLAGI